MRFRIFAARMIAALVLSSAFAGRGAEATSTNLHVIDLPAALQLAGAQNLDVRLAREKLAEARANDEGATWQFFPWLAPGFSYRAHDNLIQNIEGRLIDVHRDSYAVGPTIQAQFEVGDAIYRKLAARQLARAAGHNVEAQRQQVLLSAAAGYFDLARTQASAAVAREAVRIAAEYADQIERAVEAGLTFKGDALRARVQLERNQLSLRQAEEQRRLAGVRLAQTLQLDPTVELRTSETELLPLPLVATNLALAEFVSQALTGRAELRQFSALTQSAQDARSGAVYGPLIPSVGAQVFVGGLGGGNETMRRDLGESEDYQVTVAWRIGPGGLFDRSRVRAANARLRSAQITESKQHDEIVRQVVEGFTRVHSSGEQIAAARRGLTAAEEGFRLARQRRDLGVGIVLETILAEQELTRARLDYLRAVADHNTAQFHLRWATGGGLAAGQGREPLVAPATN